MIHAFKSCKITRHLSLASANLKLFSFKLVDIPQCNPDDVTLPAIASGSPSTMTQKYTAPTRLVSQLDIIPPSALTDADSLRQFVHGNTNPNQVFLVKKKDFEHFLLKNINSATDNQQLALGNGLHVDPLLLSPTSTSANEKKPIDSSLALANNSSQHMLAVLDSLQAAPTAPFADIAQMENKVRTRMFSQTASRNTLEEFPPPTEQELQLIEASGAGKTDQVRAILAAAYKHAIAAFETHSTGKTHTHRMRAYAYDRAWSDEQFLAWAAAARDNEPSVASSLRASPFMDVHVNSQLEKGGSALHYAAVAGRAAVAELLLAHGADVDLAAGNGSTPLHWAAGNGQLEMVQLLVRSGADPLRTTSTWCVDVFGKNSGQTALHWAAGSGHAACVAYLHALAPASLAAVDEKDNTPLSLAQKDVHMGTVKLIKEALNDDYVAMQIVQHDFNMSRVMNM